MLIITAVPYIIMHSCAHYNSINVFYLKKNLLRFIRQSDIRPNPRSALQSDTSAGAHKCLEIQSENTFSIDEMMVPYKGTKAGSLGQYLSSKPHHWGFKIFIRAGISGIVYDLLTNTGKITFGTGQGPAKELRV